MATQKGGKIDAAGEKINTIRLVTDADANAGLGDVLDPLRVDPTGTTVQPVSFSAPQHVIVDSGGGSNASVGTTGSGVPASATLVGANKSGNLTALALDASGNLNVAVQAGGGGGTQYADGTTQATPTGTVALGRNPSNVVHPLALDASGNLNTTIATALPAGTAVIGHVIVDSGAVTATLAAETTKAIGVVRASDGAGNLLTSNSTTPAAHFALDGNITAILGTAPSAAGKLDVKSAAGDLNCTLAAETTKVLGTTRTLGNTGATLDSTAAAGTAPTNALLTSLVANTSAPAPTNGQAIAQQGDIAGNLRVNPTGNVGSFAVKSVSPAAGTQITLSVPSGKKWKLKGFAIFLTTSSTVASRQPILTVQDGSSNIIVAASSPVTQAASLNQRYTFGPSLPTSASAVAANASVGFPEMCMGPTFKIVSVIQNFQATDTVTCFANVEEYND